jgi:hypothetical protein
MLPPRARSSAEPEVVVSSSPAEGRGEEASEALLPPVAAARLRFSALMTTPACDVDMLSAGPNMPGESGGGSMGDWISRDGPPETPERALEVVVGEVEGGEELRS